MSDDERDAFVAGAQWADAGRHTEAEIREAAEEWVGSDDHDRQRSKRTLPPYVSPSVVVRVLRALAGTTAPVELDADYDLVKGSPWVDFAAAKLIQTSKWVEEHDGSVGQVVMNLHEVSTARVEGAAPTDYCFAMAMGARDEATGDIHWRIDPYVVRRLNVEMPGDGTTTFKVMAREPPPGVLRPMSMGGP